MHYIKHTKNKAITRLRKLTNKYDVGYLLPFTIDGKKQPRRKNKRDVLHAIHTRNFAETKFPFYLTNESYEAHFQGKATYFYSAGMSDETLCTIDIDTDDFNTATMVANHLQIILPFSVLVERSTGGIGIHAHLVVNKKGMRPEEYNQILKEFQTELNRLTPSYPNLKQIEIKGTSGRWNRRAKHYTFGQMCKLPRLNTQEKIDDFMELRPIDAIDLPEIHIEATEEPIEEHHRYMNGGSEGGLYFKENEEKALEIYGEYAGSFSNLNNFTKDDLAIFLTILHFCADNPNDDGSMPMARLKAIWMGWFKGGCINRSYCSKRTARIRQWASQNGLIDVQSREYWFWAKPNGQKSLKKGKAMKWCLNQEIHSTVIILIHNNNNRSLAERLFEDHWEPVKNLVLKPKCVEIRIELKDDLRLREEKAIHTVQHRLAA